MQSEKANLALWYYNRGYNCAQSVVSAFTEQLKLDDRTAKRISSCFGGGMRMGATCGALSGALMMLGYAKGFNEYSSENKSATEILCVAFVEKWKSVIGSTNCKDILGLDVSNPTERQRGKDEGIFDQHCPGCIETAVKLLDEIIS